FVFEERLNQRSQNQVIEKEDDDRRQSEKPDQPAGLPPGVSFLVKKIHELPLACNTRPAAGKYFCRDRKLISRCRRTLRRSGWLPPASPWNRCRTRGRARARYKLPCAGTAIGPAGRAGRGCCPRRCTA